MGDAHHPPIRRPKAWFHLAKAAGKEWTRDKAPKEAAALAYFTLFALGPLLLLTIAITGFVIGHEAAQQRLVALIAGATGGASSEAVDAVVGGAMGQAVGLVGTLVSIGLLLVTTGAAYAHLKDALNRVWEIHVVPPEGWRGKARKFLRRNLRAFIAVLIVGILLLSSVVASTVLAALANLVGDMLPGGGIIWPVASLLVSVVLLTLAFALLFHYVPDVEVSWRDVAAGALVTAVLFVIGEALLAWYLGSGRVGDRFGVAGALVTLLVWLYYSGLIVLFGAEFTQVYANTYGSRIVPAEGATWLSERLRATSPRAADVPRDDRRRRRGRGA